MSDNGNVFEAEASTDLDNQALEIGESAEAKNGNDFDGADEGDSVVETEEKRVVMQPKDITIYQYKRWYDQGRLKLDPDWQRSYVWSGKRPSQFIESLMMSLPIPVLFLAQTFSETYEIIDGVQRLTTCFNFLNNKFRLNGLQVFSDLNGKYFKDLPSEIQSQIEDSTITCFQLSSSVSQDMLFTIFERINSGGVRLNEMEIRNCIYRGRLNDKIKDLVRDENFNQAVKMKNLHDRMLDRSLVLRFLAFYQNNYLNAQSGLRRFLNGFFEAYRNPNDAQLDDFEQRFKHAMRACYTVFGTDAFRIRRDHSGGGGYWASRVNASIFQVIATSLARIPMNVIVENSDAIYEEYLDLIGDQRFIDSVTKSTGDAGNIKYAFEAWNARINSILSGANAHDKNPRLFSKTLKEELFKANPDCTICSNRITSINDAHVDHIEQYWKGGKTIPENARLTHRVCNQSRPRSE